MALADAHVMTTTDVSPNTMYYISMNGIQYYQCDTDTVSGTWLGVTRSTEPMWRSRLWSEPAPDPIPDYLRLPEGF